MGKINRWWQREDNVRDVMLLVQRLTPLNNIWFHLSLTNKTSSVYKFSFRCPVTRMRMVTMCMRKKVRKGAKESGTKASWWQRDFRIDGIGTSEIVLSGSWVVFQIYHTTMSRISLSEKAVREPNLHLRAALAHTQLCLGGGLQAAHSCNKER